MCDRVVYCPKKNSFIDRDAINTDMYKWKSTITEDFGIYGILDGHYGTFRLDETDFPVFRGSIYVARDYFGDSTKSKEVLCTDLLNALIDRIDKNQALMHITTMGHIFNIPMTRLLHGTPKSIGLNYVVELRTVYDRFAPTAIKISFGDVIADIFTRGLVNFKIFYGRPDLYKRLLPLFKMFESNEDGMIELRYSQMTEKVGVSTIHVTDPNSNLKFCKFRRIEMAPKRKITPENNTDKENPRRVINLDLLAKTAEAQKNLETQKL